MDRLLAAEARHLEAELKAIDIRFTSLDRAVELAKREMDLRVEPLTRQTKELDDLINNWQGRLTMIGIGWTLVVLVMGWLLRAKGL